MKKEKYIVLNLFGIYVHDCDDNFWVRELEYHAHLTSCVVELSEEDVRILNCSRDTIKLVRVYEESDVLALIDKEKGNYRKSEERKAKATVKRKAAAAAKKKATAAKKKATAEKKKEKELAEYEKLKAKFEN